jgi:hypothetical protein
MMAYKIMLVMIMFSACCGALNTLGWYTHKLPDQKVAISQGQVTELTQAAGKVDINPWTGYIILKMVFNVIGSALLSLLTIIPFLMAFGVDFQIALMIQTPIWFILAWTVYELWTGHSSKMQE